MRKGLGWLAGCVMLLSTPGLAAERQVLTPSGQPDVIFSGTSLNDTVSKIANHCMNKGWQIASQSSNQVVCEIPVNVLKSAFQQALLGNSYSTTPRTFVRFTIAQVGEHTRVQAQGWTETQMVLGQVRQHQYTDDKTFNGLMGFLTEAGGQLPPGTRIPGIFLGIDGQPQTDGRTTWIPVSRVVPGSAGGKAGLQVGDHILKVAGKSFKSMDDFKSKMNKVAPGVLFPLLISREGKQMTLTVGAQERPIIGTPEADALETAAKATLPVPTQNPTP